MDSAVGISEKQVEHDIVEVDISRLRAPCGCVRVTVLKNVTELHFEGQKLRLRRYPAELHAEDPRVVRAGIDGGSTYRDAHIIGHGIAAEHPQIKSLALGGRLAGRRRKDNSQKNQGHDPHVETLHQKPPFLLVSPVPFFVFP